MDKLSISLSENKAAIKILKALVITPNDRTIDFGSLLAIARSEACKREQVSVNPPVRALVFVAELGVYVAIYETIINGKMINQNSAVGKLNKEKSQTGRFVGCE
jgi:hypothetical protein